MNAKNAARFVLLILIRTIQFHNFQIHFKYESYFILCMDLFLTTKITNFKFVYIFHVKSIDFVVCFTQKWQRCANRIVMANYTNRVAACFRFVFARAPLLTFTCTSTRTYTYIYTYAHTHTHTLTEQLFCVDSVWFYALLNKQVDFELSNLFKKKHIFRAIAWI